MKKIIQLFKKLLDYVPEFPGASFLSGQSDFVDLREDLALVRKRRLAGKLLLGIFVLSGLLLFQFHAFLERIQTEVEVIQNRGSMVIKADSSPIILRPRYTILVLGKENDQRADTVILVHLMVDKRHIRVLSFPRDTRMEVVREGELMLSKLSHTFRWGGLDLLMETLQNFFGVKVDHTVVIDLALFRRIVDTLGGIEVEVKKDLFYEDHSAGLKIDIKKGKQKLNGKDAEGYVRFRADKMGDLGRIERQQEFLKSFFERLRSLKQFRWENVKVLGRLPVFVVDLVKDVDTSLDADEILRLLAGYSGVNRKHLDFKTLPGQGEYIYDFEYKKKINYYISTTKQRKDARDWFLGTGDYKVSAHNEEDKQ